MKRRIMAALSAAALALLAAQAFAHADKPPAATRPISPERHPWGKEGDPRKAVRTIEVDLADTMRFTPSEVRVRRGDTVTFVARNSGKVMHEMVLGTEAELKSHAELMKKHPGMEHDAPYMAHVRPGGKEVITWTFDQPGTFMYGCLIPGHWESGMKGTIVVAK
jgi:uncharacterized cupredoxin-like copper-binding protein